MGEKTENTYARQALPMVWDYSEANPFGGASGDVSMQLDLILDVIDHAISSAPGRPATVLRGRAQRLPLEDRTIDAVICDPPYYDNISYADLSDFFYVWHKRAAARAQKRRVFSNPDFHTAAAHARGSRRWARRLRRSRCRA